METRGFTLIEVLVALTIVAVALLSSMRAVGVMAQSGSEVQLRLLAQLSARNQIALLRATKAFPPLGSATASCPQGDVVMLCRTQTKSTPNAFFRRAEVRVYLASQPERQLAELVGILPNER